MKILLYLSAGNGDLINFTGVLRALKVVHPDYIFDMLIPKKHYVLIKGHPAVNNVLFIDDYPEIPIHCTHENHDAMILKIFKSKYNRVLNAWGCKIQSENDGDYANTMFKLMRQYGFVLPFDRYNINPVFYYDLDDYKKIYDFYEQVTKPLVFIENESRSWNSPQIKHLGKINEYLLSSGYMTAGNGSDYSIDLKDLNLKECKLFFDKMGAGFLGLSSGMTCAMYANPNDYINKTVCVSGIYDGWNVGAYLDSRVNYKYFYNPYTVNDIKILFKELE